MNASEAAKAAGTTQPTIGRWIAAGKLRARRGDFGGPGSRPWIIEPDDLDAALVAMGRPPVNGAAPDAAETIPAAQLAAALGEAPNADPRYLLSKTANLVAFASSRRELDIRAREQVAERERLEAQLADALGVDGDTPPDRLLALARERSAPRPGLLDRARQLVARVMGGS